MRIYVNANAGRDGNGTANMPFRHINDAAKVAKAGDEVLVSPGVYREYVNPIHAGEEDARISYRSTEPLGAVITGAEQVKNERINDQNARAENGAVLMIIPGDVGNGKQNADRREKNERLAQRLGIGRHKITSVGFSEGGRAE